MTPGPRDPRPVFLSASEPDPHRRPEYWDSRQLLRVREAVRAVAAYVLPRQPLVFGGHPAVTPLVDAIAVRIAHDARESEGKGASPRVLRFLSHHFAAQLPPDVASRPDTVLTPAMSATGDLMPPASGDRAMSLLLMRYAMIGRPGWPLVVERVAPHWQLMGQERELRFGTLDFAAAVFIGGMEGVEREFNIFRHFHPKTPAWPIASTGSAAVTLLDRMRLPGPLMRMLREETVYSLVVEDLLSEHSSLVSPPSPGVENHLDPPVLGSS